MTPLRRQHTHSLYSTSHNLKYKNRKSNERRHAGGQHSSAHFENIHSIVPSHAETLPYILHIMSSSSKSLKRQTWNDKVVIRSIWKCICILKHAWVTYICISHLSVAKVMYRWVHTRRRGNFLLQNETPPMRSISDYNIFVYCNKWASCRRKEGRRWSI